MVGSLNIIRKRSDFLACNKGRRQNTAGFVLLGRDRKDGTDDIRIGYTCSKKLGNAVTRNRAKRRLREVARLGLPGFAREGWDYVLIGKPEATVSRTFAEMQNDLARALKAMHP